MHKIHNFKLGNVKNLQQKRLGIYFSLLQDFYNLEVESMKLPTPPNAL